jgi:hypothetical protein
VCMRRRPGAERGNEKEGRTGVSIGSCKEGIMEVRRNAPLKSRTRVVKLPTAIPPLFLAWLHNEWYCKTVLIQSHPWVLSHP